MRIEGFTNDFTIGGFAPSPLQLTDLGIAPTSISFSTVTLESDKFICVREVAGDAAASQVAIIETQNRSIQRMRNSAEAALMNPSSKVIALRGVFHLDSTRLAQSSPL